MYAVNEFAVVDILQITSRLMARNGGGSFVNIASITGVAGSPGQVAYSSSKGAVIAMTKSAAKELSPLNIRVNAVAPGIIETERFKELYSSWQIRYTARCGKRSIIPCLRPCELYIRTHFRRRWLCLNLILVLYVFEYR